MAVINLNNFIAKVVSLIQDKPKGDTVLLVDQHLPNVLKTVCKFVAETKPLGHEKLLLEQTIALYPNITQVLGQEYKQFTYTGFTYLFVETGRFHRATAIIDAAVVVSGAGTAAVNGTYTVRGTHNTFPYYNLVGQPNSTSNYCVRAETVAGDEWSITNSTGGTAYYANDFTPPSYPYTTGAYIQVLGANPVPTVTQSLPVSERRGYSVKTMSSLRLSNTHEVFYYFIEPLYVFINLSTADLGGLFSIKVTHYIYATAAQFPEELEDLLTAEMVRVISNEASKQDREDKTELK